MEICFYDRTGKPVAYSQDDVHIFLFTGEPVAYFQNESLYTFDGSHLGWYKNGWIRDHHGHCVFFSNHATGGPMKPMKQMKPMKSMKRMKPMKSIKSMAPMKPMFTSSWSEFSGANFFSDRR